jgi:hypothetical protein
MYNNEFQWLLKDRFHIIYHIVATSFERNSYRITRVGIYTHFSSKSIFRATIAPPDCSRIPRRQCVSLEIKKPFLLSEFPINGSSDQTFLSSGWPTKWLFFHLKWLFFHLTCMWVGTSSSNPSSWQRPACRACPAPPPLLSSPGSALLL